MTSLKLGYKIWLETDCGYVFGEGPFKVLQKIRERGTLRGATEELGMSYRYAWGLIKDIENKLGVPLLRTYKGGGHGGGGAVLMDEAKELLKTYERAERAFFELSQQLNTELVSS